MTGAVQTSGTKKLSDPTAISKPKWAQWKRVLWTALAGLLFGIVGFGEIAEDWLRVARNGFHKHDASGDIVILKIDDQSLHEIGNWPWPRKTDAELVDKLTEAGAKQIVFDINFNFPSADPSQDVGFADALRRSGIVSLAARTKTGVDGTSLKGVTGRRIDIGPMPMFAQHARVGVISAQYNYQNAVWRLPYAFKMNGRTAPSLASILSGVSGEPSEFYTIDYSLDLESIPSFPAADMLKGRLPANRVAGKTVLIGPATDSIGDVFFIPGHGRGFGAQIQAIAAETLKVGRPVNLGWLGAFAISLALGAAAISFQRRTPRYLVLAGAFAGFLIVPVFLESRLIFVDVTPALFVLLTIASVDTWRWFRARGLVHASSGLPNLNALNTFAAGRKQALVAARVLNYEDAVATLPSGCERLLVEQITSRLAIGDPERTIYQGDGGIFAWFCDPKVSFGSHLEALHSLFRNPARVGDLSVDLTLSFGVELGSRRSLPSRLASALVAADDAAREGYKWRLHDPETLQNAAWRLSMLSQLDEAIDQGEVWVAYQPKLDLREERIVGAEALARWTHPEKGPIPVTEFVAAAEHQNRIAKLTDFVLDQALAAAVAINRRTPPFEIAVNMSAKLMTDRQFILRLNAALARHGLDPRLLTLELTETAALASTGEGLEMIGRLRALGINIAIDDYGTGLSTLDYLKRVPANEIKIDRSFVRAMLDNRSDRLMVQSTIELAHSLGRRVVAEGAEVREIVKLLAELDCDIAQGFAIGRPMSREALIRRLNAERKRSVA